MAGENKTKQTEKNALEFLDEWVEGEQKRQDSLVLMDIMERVTGHAPKMWGPSIIGFGSYHYISPGGREGNWPAIAFSPRKAALTLYIVTDTERYADEIAALGKCKTSKACIYVKKLADIDTDQLAKLIEKSYKDLQEMFVVK